ncbi:MAG: D-aminoacyl-tRNA deacylase [Paludibacteraceae bacterium]
MRIILQRVSSASVAVSEDVVGTIHQGFLLLVGITHTDTTADADYLARKIAQLRVFSDKDGKLNLSLRDVGGSVLSVSQFTLFADTRRGNRPSFVEAARPEQAEQLYQYFNDHLRNAYLLHVETGIFGADMQVSLINDGPLTILLDSKQRS